MMSNLSKNGDIAVNEAGGKRGRIQLNKRLYSVWRGMLGRCYRPNRPGYKYYGGKGITVEFDGWHDFRDWAFQNGYADNLTIDRLDPNGNYSKENCEWVTQSENSRRSALYHGHNVYEGTKKERKAQHDRAYRETHRDALKIRKHDYYERNKPEISKKSKDYRDRPEIKAKKREYDKRRRATEEYKRKHKEYNARYNERRKAANGTYEQQCTAC